MLGLGVFFAGSLIASFFSEYMAQLSNYRQQLLFYIPFIVFVNFLRDYNNKRKNNDDKHQSQKMNKWDAYGLKKCFYDAMFVSGCTFILIIISSFFNDEFFQLSNYRGWILLYITGSFLASVIRYDHAKRNMNDNRAQHLIMILCVLSIIIIFLFL